MSLELTNFKRYNKEKEYTLDGSNGIFRTKYELPNVDKSNLQNYFIHAEHIGFLSQEGIRYVFIQICLWLKENEKHKDFQHYMQLNNFLFQAIEDDEILLWD